MALMKRPDLQYWMVVNGLSGAVMFTLLWFLHFLLGFVGSPQFGGPPVSVLLEVLFYIGVPAVLMGAALGFGQGLTLFEEWRCRWRWTLVSIVGMVVAVIYFVVTHDRVFAGMQTVFNYLVSGVALGLLVGAVQWVELRRSSDIQSIHWIWGNAAVWGLSVAIGWSSAWVIGGGALLVLSVLYAAGMYYVRGLMTQEPETTPQHGEGILDALHRSQGEAEQAPNPPVRLQENPRYGVWFLVNALGIGLLWLMMTQYRPYMALASGVSFGLLIGYGAASGGPLGFLQGIMLLTRWRDRLLWLLATMLGALAGWVFLFRGHYFLGLDFYLSVDALHLTGFVFGLAIGGLQWLILRRCSVSNALYWVWGSAAAWGSAYFSMTLFPTFWSAVLAMCVVYAAIMLLTRRLISWRRE